MSAPTCPDCGSTKISYPPDNVAEKYQDWWQCRHCESSGLNATVELDGKKECEACGERKPLDQFRPGAPIALCVECREQEAEDELWEMTRREQ